MSGLRLQSASTAASARRSSTDSLGVSHRQGLNKITASRDDSFQAAPKKVLSTLRRGATGSEVRGVQAKLQVLGLMKTSDVKSGPGVYGPRTEQAVKRFQKRLGLPATGLADPLTRAMLMRAERKDHEATAPIDAHHASNDSSNDKTGSITALDVSRAAQTITDEDDEATIELIRAS